MSNGKAQSKELDGVNTHAADPLLNMATVAKAVGKHPSTVRSWVDSGLIDTVRCGKLPKIRKSDLVKLLSGTKLGDNIETLERVDLLVEDMDDRGPEPDYDRSPASDGTQNFRLTDFKSEDLDGDEENG